MTGPSLKEQLEALSLTSSSPKTSVKNHKKQAIALKSSSKQKPAWLEQAQYGVELLKAYFPNCFKDLKEIKPLKIGIKQDLVKFLSSQEGIVVSDKACMVNSLAYYVNSIHYHQSVLAGRERIDLNGDPSGIVTTEEASYSEVCRQTKVQKKQVHREQKVRLATSVED